MRTRSRLLSNARRRWGPVTYCTRVTTRRRMAEGEEKSAWRLLGAGACGRPESSPAARRCRVRAAPFFLGHGHAAYHVLRPAAATSNPCVRRPRARNAAKSPSAEALHAVIAPWRGSGAAVVRSKAGRRSSGAFVDVRGMRARPADVTEEAQTPPRTFK